MTSRAPVFLAIASCALLTAAVPDRLTFLPSSRLTALPSVRPPYDVLLRGGTLIDGTGSPRRDADVAVQGDRIVAIGDLSGATATRVVDARGLVVAPGFIDMLGWSQTTILVDNRGVSKVTQGVTTEITGEGWSPAPVSAAMLREDSAQYAAWGLTVDWRDLDGYFRRLERSGTPFNLGTFVGATTVRMYVLGESRRAPTRAELRQMEALTDTAMRQGALGVATSLGYAPASYARTDELIALARVAARHGGIYASHIRSEGPRIREALAEAWHIGREARIPVEVWHLKLSGRGYWGRMPEILAAFDSVRAAGVDAWANSYPYTATANNLSSIVPAWAHAGGKDSLLARLRDPATRARIRADLTAPRPGVEATVSESGGLGGILILSVLDTSLRRYQGRRLTELAQAEGKDPYDFLLDLLIADGANTGRASFSMSEADVRLAVATPWVGVGSDFGARAPDGPLFQGPVHPRAYGTFPRILGRYVREQGLLSLEAAVRKMTGVPAERVHLRERGLLREGWFADITVFDPATVADRATFEDSHQVSEGIRYVLVNGRFTLDEGRLTAERPGRALRGPGWRGDR
jgi:dihydroorotase/N-acyl-D-amino-acid deacylase